MNHLIAVCDDEPEQARLVAAMAGEWAKCVGLSCEIRCFPSAEALWFAYEENRSFDILLLDVEIKGNMLYFYLLNAAGKKQDKIGSLFLTGKVGGHGFGLHRAETILRQHGGWVKYNSEDGAFTSEFLVPAAP